MSYKNAPLDDVLDLLMLQEPKPAYSALLRWRERYPQYRKELTAFFATWAVQSVQAGEVDIDEEKLVNFGVQYGLEIARRQGRVAATTGIESLQPFDQLVL